MPLFEKHFTLEEARAELPALKIALTRVHDLIAELREARVEIQRVQKLLDANGHAVSQPDFSPQVAELQLILRAISDQGIEVKDMERGLVDFPHWRDGEEVLLCWLREEEDIAYWHTVEGGFAGRARL